MMQGETIPRRRVLALGAALAGLCVGCSVLPTAEETAASEEVSTISGTPVEKQPDDSIHLRDNDGLYTVYDDSGVVTMYLTVTRGNEAENTDHTWAEINSYSVYDYEYMQVPRYQTAALLQVGDENARSSRRWAMGRRCRTRRSRSAARRPAGTPRKTIRSS